MVLGKLHYKNFNQANVKNIAFESNDLFRFVLDYIVFLKHSKLLRNKKKCSMLLIINVEICSHCYFYF